MAPSTSSGGDAALANPPGNRLPPSLTLLPLTSGSCAPVPPTLFPYAVTRSRLESLLASPELPPTRVSNLRSLLRAMDPHGVSMLQPRRPNSVGPIPGGRTTYRDQRSVGNAFLTCNATARAFVFGAYWDEIDISRSHFTSVLGRHLAQAQEHRLTILGPRAAARRWVAWRS